MSGPPAFVVLTLTRSDDELTHFAQSFSNVTGTFKGLLETTPFGAKTLNELGSSELNMYWDPDKVNSILMQVAGLQAKLDQLTERLKTN